MLRRGVAFLLVLLAPAFASGAAPVAEAGLGLVAEPGGATALAGILSGAFTPPPGSRIGVLVCGSNTDPASVVG
jgi:threonine dehydratase